jgi:hypothetical protein
MDVNLTDRGETESSGAGRRSGRTRAPAANASDAEQNSVALYFTNFVSKRQALSSTRLAFLAILAVGCAGRATPPQPPAAGSACTLLQAPAVPPDTIRVALTEPVDPAHAPIPRNRAERLLFAQLYERLLRVDCTGRVLPGLARSWSADASGRGWTLTLRDDARFWSGAPVSANDVLASWRATAAADGAGSLAATLAAGAVARDERTIHITLPDSLTPSLSFNDSAPDAPIVLAAPELAVARAGSTTSWQEGTTAFHVLSGESGRGTITLAPVGGATPRIVVHVTPGADARDLLDQGTDLIVVERPSVVQYATTQPQWTSVPLPWERTYVLLIPARARANASAPPADTSVGASALAFGAALADAVHADARGATPPFWWRDLRASDGALPPQDGSASRPPASNPRIVYDRDDSVARDLAERLVALAGSGRAMADPGATLGAVAPELLRSPTVPRAAGVDSTELARALRQGAELGYVVPLPRTAIVPRLALSRLVAALPWISDARTLDAVVVPLVDVRRSTIMRQGTVGLAAEWDGTPIILTNATRQSDSSIRKPRESRNSAQPNARRAP